MNVTRGLVFVVAPLVALSASVASGQVVQLPTLRTFSYSGSVQVPDRGTMSMGGFATSARSWRRRGVGPSTGIGPATNAGGASVTATVIDLKAMDRQIRGEAAASDQVVSPAQIEEGKTLVRYARRMRDAGNDALARSAYQLAFKKLDPRLRRLARAELQRHYGGSDVTVATPRR